MYWLKCWRDMRSSFFTFFGTLLISYLFYCAVVLDWFGWVEGRALGAQPADWHYTAVFTVKLVLFLMGLASFLFATEGLPRDFERKTMPYLLTRPRSRRYFLAVNWTTAVLLLIVLLAGGLLLEALLPAPLTRPTSPFRWIRWAQMSVVVTIPAIVIYSFTFCLCILLRSARNGLRFAFGITLMYSLLTTYLAQFGIELPNLVSFAASALQAPGCGIVWKIHRRLPLRALRNSRIRGPQVGWHSRAA